MVREHSSQEFHAKNYVEDCEVKITKYEMKGCQKVVVKMFELLNTRVLLLWDGNGVSGIFYPGKTWGDLCSIDTGKIKVPFQYSDIDEISSGVAGYVSVIKLLP